MQVGIPSGPKSCEVASETSINAEAARRERTRKPQSESIERKKSQSDKKRSKAKQSRDMPSYS